MRFTLATPYFATSARSPSITAGCALSASMSTAMRRWSSEVREERGFIEDSLWAQADGGSSRRTPGPAIDKIPCRGERVSRPAVCVLRKPGALYAHHAESLPRWRLHHHPPFQATHHAGPQAFQPGHLSGNVIGFDVDVHAALMLDALYLHDRLVGRRFQHAVVAARARVTGVDRTAQCPGPEARGLVDIGGVAIDQQGAQS